MGTAGGMTRASIHPSLGRRTPASNEDFFDEDQLRELREYIAPLRRAGRIHAALGLAITTWLVFGLELGPRAAGWVADQGWFIRLLVVGAAFDVASTVVGAPFSYWSDLIYERRAGHSTTTLDTWVKDLVKSLVLMTVLTGVLFGPLYAAIHATDLWWLVGGLAILVVVVGYVFVYPTVIMPRFNKFTPLEDGPIRQRIFELAARSGLEIEGAYMMDASKRTRRANAFVAGFGASKRVVINDTIADYPLDLLSQVITHELGHYRLNHVVKSFPLQAIALPFTLAFLQLVVGTDTVLGWAGVSDIGDPASYGLLVLGMRVPGLVLGPVGSWFSRKHEREADLEALEVLGDPTSMAALWPKLVLTDKGNLEPTWWERLNASHPAPAERIQFALDWAKMNDVPVTRPARGAVPEAAAASA